jgi:hypothetical protein
VLLLLCIFSDKTATKSDCKSLRLLFFIAEAFRHNFIHISLVLLFCSENINAMTQYVWNNTGVNGEQRVQK